MSTATRASDLRQMLHERRRHVQDDILSRVRGTRSDRPTEVRDHLEHSDASTQGDIELALVQMRADTLTRIDHALARLDAGKYGSCVECARDIAERRLRALPFAVRCQACEERREQEHGRARARSEEQQPVALLGRALFLRAWTTATVFAVRRSLRVPCRAPPWANGCSLVDRSIVPYRVRLTA